MSFLKKIASVLFHKKDSGEPTTRKGAADKGQKPARDGKNRKPGRDGNGQRRGNRPQKRDEGNPARAERNEERRQRFDKDRTDKERDGARSARNHESPRNENVRPEGHREEGRNEGRGEGQRRERSGDRSRVARPRGDRQGRPRSQRTASGEMRPGGALTAEEVQKNLEIHAQWDPASYVVAPEEGKKTFIDMGLPSEILHAVADLGFQYCTPIQAQSLEHALAGHNVAGKAQTGTGKTAAFLIAVLTRYLKTPEKRNQPGMPRTLILAPTRELVIQICKDAEALGKYCGNIRTLAVYGGMDLDRQREELTDAPVDLLVATPGRLLDFVRQRTVNLHEVDTLVIDEADRMLDMGFIPDVRAIVNRLPDREHRCTMLYSATLDEVVMRLASQWMQDPVRIEIEGDAITTDNIRQLVYITTSNEKFKILYNHIHRYADARILIFCNRKSTTEAVADNLRRLGIPCETLSGDVQQNKRLRVLEDFRAGVIRTVVATDVAGRGIHVDDIAFVVNFDFPYEPEDYVHRIGRTGRAGATGVAISFADEDESFTIPDIEAYIKEPLKCTQPEEWLLAELPPPQARSRRGDRRTGSTNGRTPAEAPSAADTTEPTATPATTSTAMDAPVETPMNAPTEVSNAPAETPATPEANGTAEAPVVETPAIETPTPEVTPAPETPAPAVTTVAEPAPVAEPAAKSTEAIGTPGGVQVRMLEGPDGVMRMVVEKPGVEVSITTPAAETPAPTPTTPVTVQPQGRTPDRPVGRQGGREGRESRYGRARRNDRDGRAPRNDRATARRFEERRIQAPDRTQAQGPRDGSESHHAAAIPRRPIYGDIHKPGANDTWSPGQ